mmetsp:Transcript_47936/g.127873  ORF Transcript_47936/g.127873 Transcript_47936/m.127873 type:complete len:235 (+) Transcript_47936:201-905(+)
MGRQPHGPRAACACPRGREPPDRGLEGVRVPERPAGAPGGHSAPGLLRPLARRGGEGSGQCVPQARQEDAPGQERRHRGGEVALPEDEGAIRGAEGSAVRGRRGGQEVWRGGGACGGAPRGWRRSPRQGGGAARRAAEKGGVRRGRGRRQGQNGTREQDHRVRPERPRVAPQDGLPHAGPAQDGAARAGGPVAAAAARRGCARGAGGGRAGLTQGGGWRGEADLVSRDRTVLTQ